MFLQIYLTAHFVAPSQNNMVAASFCHQVVRLDKLLVHCNSSCSLFCHFLNLVACLAKRVALSLSLYFGLPLHAALNQTLPISCTTVCASSRTTA